MPAMLFITQCVMHEKYRSLTKTTCCYGLLLSRCIYYIPPRFISWRLSMKGLVHVNYQSFKLRTCVDGSHFVNENQIRNIIFYQYRLTKVHD